MSQPPLLNLTFLPSHSSKIELNPLLLTIPIATEVLTLAMLPSLHGPQRLLLLSVSFPVVLSSCCYIVLYTTSSYAWLSYGAASAAVFVVYQAVDLLWVSWRDGLPVEEVFYRTDREEGYETGWLRCGDDVYPVDGEGLWGRRIKWATDLVFCLRGVGWNIESRKTLIEREKEKDVKRRQFLWREIKTIVGIYLLLDFLKTYMSLDPWFFKERDAAMSYVPKIDPGSMAFTMPLIPQQVQVFIAGIGLMFFRNLLGGLAVYAAVEGESSALAFFMVLCNFSTPSEFPRPFGSITDRKCWSLAGFWGNGWHQTFRRVFTAPVRGRKGVGRLFVPFCMSSVLHFAGSYVAGGLGKEAIVFFWVQPLGVVVQNLGVRLLEMMLGVNKSSRRNEYANGYANGYTNGYANGKSNGYTRPHISIGNTSHISAGVRAVRPSFETSGSKIVEAFTLVTSLVWLLSVSTRYFEEYVRGGMFTLEPVPFSLCRFAGMVDGEWVRW